MLIGSILVTGRDTYSGTKENRLEAVIFYREIELKRNFMMILGGFILLI